MDIIWLIENCFKNIENLCKSINDSGASYVLFEKNQNYDVIQDKIYVLYGSVQFVKKFSSKNPKPFPGHFYDAKNFETSTYLTYWQEKCLNDDAIFISYGEFKRRKDFFYSIFKDDVFIRPNSCDKIFTGLSIDKNDWKIETNSLDKLTSVLPETIIAVSSKKKILNEWRFIVSQRKIITSSYYSWNDDEKICVPIEAENLVNDVINHWWQPEIAFVLDVCS
jgi:hypothetical protein